MPTQRVPMRNIKEVLRLKFDCDLSHERIARALGLSKGVVSKYVARARLAGLDGVALATLDEAEIARRLCPAATTQRGERAAIDLPWVHRELRRKGVTLQLLWQEYGQTQTTAPPYQYTQFCAHYHAYAGSLRRSMRQVHRAGEKLFIDYAGPTVDIVNPDTGEIRPAHIFVAVLGASNYTYACATAGETQVDWLRGLGQALQFYGGVPALVVPDNPRALIKHPDRYEPELNRATQAFAEHYGTAILPARPRKPQDKAKVEAGVLLVERWILARLRHQRFFTLAAPVGKVTQSQLGLPPAEALFAAVRLAMSDLLKVPMKDSEVAVALNVSGAQAKAWLQRLVDEGVVEKQKKPAGYVMKQRRLFE